MLKQRFFLGSVAFGISFGISFLTGRDVGKAIATSTTTAVIAVAAAIAVDRQYYQSAHTRIADLKDHIQALQKRRAETYQAYMQLEAERAQLTDELGRLSIQPQPPRLVGSPWPAALPASRKALSWDLSAPADTQPAIAVPPYDRPTEIPSLDRPPWGQSDAMPPQLLTEATATKRKIEASLAALQTELSQIKGQISDHRQTREKLSRELVDLREQKRQLDATTKALRGEVKELEACRVELEQFLTDATVKKQELETGSHPLQEMLRQLQTQTTLLQAELHELETHILDRRHQKALLEETLAKLQTVAPSTEPLSLPALTVNPPDSRNGNYPGSAPASTRMPVKPSQSRRSSPSPSVATVLPEPITAEPPASDLPPEWTELMVQLPDYEFQVLKVIVEQTNPAAIIKRIAEENLTMPELLVDSINERALDTVGDILIDASAGAGAAAIVRDHLKMVKKLIKTYEYLAN